MTTKDEHERVVGILKNAVADSREKIRRLKVKTLMPASGTASDRREHCADHARFAGCWNPCLPVRHEARRPVGTFDGRLVYFPSLRTRRLPASRIGTYPLASGLNCDGWFDQLATKKLRTEKEVETKFIIPLLARWASRRTIVTTICQCPLRTVQSQLR